MTGRSRVLVAIPLAALVLATPPLVSEAAPAAPAAPTSEATAEQPVRQAPTPAGIDTSDKAAVARAYRSQYQANVNTPIGWTGKNARCRAGRPSAKAHRATLESLNFVRALGGLAPVRWGKVLSAKAQKAALIMSANNSLSHDPPRSWKCWTKAGAEAAGRSNLALAYPSITAGGVIGQYMDDMGSSNIFAGHRRWLMYPDATVFGSGSTRTSNAIWVVGPTFPDRPNPAWVSWPTAGWFPSGLEPDGRWSLSAGDSSTDFSKARVAVKTAGGASRRVHVYPVAVGFGRPTLVWDVKNIRAKGTYKVTVRGIKREGRRHPFAHSYAVRIFDPADAR